MNEDDYKEALNELKDDFKDYLYKIDQFLGALSDDESYEDAVNNLYLTFDTLRGAGKYLKIDPIIKATNCLCDALLTLRHKKPPIKQDMLDWLLMISDHISSWRYKIEQCETDIEPIDSYLLSMLKTTSISTEKTDNILKKLTILLVEPSEKTRQTLKSFLEKSCKKTYTASSSAAVLKSIEKFRPDIILTSSDFEADNFLDFIQTSKEFYKNVPFVVMVRSNADKSLLLALDKLSIDAILLKPLNSKTLLDCLFQVAKIFYEEKWVKIANKELNSYIQNLQPLEANIKKVREISINKDASSKDLSSVISQDPIMTSQVLKAVNSPLYGFRQDISSINHATSLLGKDKICAIILQDAFKNQIQAVDLSPYGINEDTFYKVAKMRLDLMGHWFSKVSLQDLAILSTSSLLGNLGQILIAKEAINQKLKDDFLTIISQTKDSNAAEAQFFNTTTEDITADILAYWGLENNLVNSIRFSFDLTSAPSDIKHLCIANYVVFSTIKTLSAEINFDVIEEMSDFLKEMNFNPTAYKEAIKKLQE